MNTRIDNKLPENRRSAVKTIVVVDDHVLFRQGLISLLSSQADFKVIDEARYGSEAVIKVGQHKPDLVLLDITLPDGSGLDFIQQMLSRSPNTKIVILTVHEVDDLLLIALSAGAKGYIYKSTPVSDLLASLRALERGEAAITRSMTRRILEEFARLTNLINDNHHKGGFNMLSPREMEVLKQLGTNASNREIANTLVITEHTVKIHVHNILTKLNVPNRQAAGNVARRLGATNHHPDAKFDD